MENKKYYLKYVSFSYVKNGKYVGDDEYEMEIRYRDKYNDLYKKYFTIFYDEDEVKNINGLNCWHCSIPFINIYFKGTYLKNDFFHLKFQHNFHNFICKNCYFFLKLYDYNRDYIFNCVSCKEYYNIIYANAVKEKCHQTYFDTYKDLVCLRCSQLISSQK